MQKKVLRLEKSKEVVHQQVVASARYLIKNKIITPERVKEINSYFSTHKNNETVDWLLWGDTVTNLARTLRDLKEAGVWIVGADAGGESLFEADVTGPIAWVLGAEGEGLRRLTREHCDRFVGIPLAGSVDSLNVSVAAGICLFATRRARSAVAVAAPR